MRNNTTATYGKRNGKGKGSKGKNYKSNAESRSCESNSSSENSNEYNHQGSDKVFNDPDWYINSEQILKDVARVPYSIPVGTCFDRSGKLNIDSDYTASAYDNALPGIMVSFLMPTLGATEQDASAGVNIAANSVFQFVRSKISGSRKYEAVDMMIYLGAMDSIFTNLTWATRAYATAYTYHQSNKYLAQAILEAQGIDFDDFVNNLPNFRTAINIEIAKIRSMFLPSVMPIFKRHSWMFSHYFIEGDSEKDQIYMHAPAGYYVFDLDDQGKGKLHAFSNFHANKLKWTDIVQMIRDQINAIFRREDFNTISGDMLKAYEGNVFTLTEIPDIATVSLTYSSEVLLQFKNGKYKNVLFDEDGDGVSTWRASFFDYIQNSSSDLLMIGNTTLYGTPSMQAFLAVTVSNDNSVIEPSTAQQVTMSKAVANEWTKDIMLTTPTHDVQPVENMINTRLTLGLNYSLDATAINGLRYKEAYFGSEWPVVYKLFTYHRQKSNGHITLFSRTYDRALILTNDVSYIWVSSQEPVRSAFKYLPEISVIAVSTYEGNFEAYEPGRSIFEVDNYALINNATINGMHTAAILGEYNIPNLSIGR